MFSARRTIASADSRSPWSLEDPRLEATLSLAAQGGAPSALVFKPDGTKFFVTDSVLRAIREYSLSTAWDITSATYVRQISSDATFTPACLAFRPDGSNMYFTRAGQSAFGHRLYGYSLSTAWDLSTASYTYLSDPLPQGIDVSGISFSDAGDRLYVSALPNSVYEYSLPSAWTVSNITQASATSFGNYDGVGAIHFANSGNTAFLPFLQAPSAGGLWRIALSSPWSLATISSPSPFFFAAGGSTAGVHVTPDGKQMFLLNSVTNDSSIRQYSLAT